MLSILRESTISNQSGQMYHESHCKSSDGFDQLSPHCSLPKLPVVDSDSQLPWWPPDLLPPQNFLICLLPEG